MTRPGEEQAGHVIGVDVGTSSARAGVFDLEGTLLGHAIRPIETHAPRPDHYEQSTEDIWESCSQVVREAVASGGIDPASVLGLSFDATSSVAALDDGDLPVTVSTSGDDRWNVILWMDHRALEQTERINRTGHDVLRYVGGKISPEMVCPKLLWVKENLPDSWRRSRRFLDLTDFLTYRASGVDARSLCTTVCKWTYLGHREEGGWARDFFRSIGLDALHEERRSGERIVPMGTPLGGLTPAAAADFGLPESVAVGAGVIDAHAGGIGLLGEILEGQDDPEAALERGLALIGGTSSCHMAVSREPKFLPGIWGPYYSAMVPGLWLTEGGQTTSGSLIEHVIEDSAAAPELRARASSEGRTVYEVLNDALRRLGGGEVDPELTRELHVLPYFLGNRSPRANPTLRGVISGLTLDRSADAVAVRYLAAIQAIAYGTRHIIESMNAGGYAIDSLLVCGGGIKNPVWLQEHADSTGCRLHLPREPEAVLLGGAILGAVAAGAYPGVIEAMTAMSRSERIVEPRAERREYHDRKYRAFHHLYDSFMELRGLMDGGEE